jgi:hypothetical protein
MASGAISREICGIFISAFDLFHNRVVFHGNVRMTAAAACLHMYRSVEFACIDVQGQDFLVHQLFGKCLVGMACKAELRVIRAACLRSARRERKNHKGDDKKN